MVAVSLAVVWLLLVTALVLATPKDVDPRSAVRLLPDTLRMLRSILGDRTLGRGVRVRVWLLVAYLLSPIDLIPDVIPVLGFADDVVITVLALRSVVRAAGAEAIERHWPGTADGLAAVLRLSGATHTG